MQQHRDYVSSVGGTSRTGVCIAATAKERAAASTTGCRSREGETLLRRMFVARIARVRAPCRPSLLLHLSSSHTHSTFDKGRDRLDRIRRVLAELIRSSHPLDYLA